MKEKLPEERTSLIDIIKGICIIFVIITHVAWADEERLRMLFPFWIDLAVPVFMIISGYVYSLSFNKNKTLNLIGAYKYSSIAKRIVRYSIPFGIAYLFEVVMLCLFKKYEYNIITLFFSGGIGPGSYYYPVMIQFIFVFPIIYFVIKDHDFNGLIICGLVNIFYEFIKNVYGMSAGEYRILIFRHLLFIAFGCYMAIGRRKIKEKVLILFFVIGAFWQYLVEYTNYKPHVIDAAWADRSCLTALYIAPIMSMILGSKKAKNTKNKLLEIIGKSSFNIFLTQMVYYNISGKISDMLNINKYAICLLNMFVCCFVGVIFYYIERSITKNVLEHLEKNAYYEKKAKSFMNKVGNILTSENVGK